MARSCLAVDASVVVKWLLPEEDRDRALLIRDLYQDERLDLIAPYLLVGEVGNVLWRRVRTGDLTRDQGRRCFEQLLRDSPILLDSPDTSRSAFEIAVAHDRTVYDCLYLAQALEHRCDLVTADQKFYGYMRPAFPAVKLLAEFE